MQSLTVELEGAKQKFVQKLVMNELIVLSIYSERWGFSRRLTRWWAHSQTMQLSWVFPSMRSLEAYLATFLLEIKLRILAGFFSQQLPEFLRTNHVCKAIALSAYVECKSVWICPNRRELCFKALLHKITRLYLAAFELLKLPMHYMQWFGPATDYCCLGFSWNKYKHMHAMIVEKLHEPINLELLRMQKNGGGREHLLTHLPSTLHWYLTTHNLLAML